MGWKVDAGQIGGDLQPDWRAAEIRRTNAMYLALERNSQLYLNNFEHF
jgi:hypothetical protein